MPKDIMLHANASTPEPDRMPPCFLVYVCALMMVLLEAIGSTAAASEDISAELRRLTQENLDALAPGIAEVWRRNAHDNLIHVDEQGIVRNKAELLAELQPLPKGLVGRLEIDKFHVIRKGDTAVATHENQEYLDYHGQILRSRWRITDTWVQTPQGWRLLAEQILALQGDPPAITLPRSKLCQYNGAYRLNESIRTQAECGEDGLRFTRDGEETLYRAEAEDVFFAPGRPRTRRIFQRGTNGEITGFVDRREGHDIRWARVKS